MKIRKGQMQLVGVMIGIMVSVIIGVAVVIPVITDQINGMTALASNTQTNVNSLNGTTLTLAYGNLLPGTFSATVVNASSNPALVSQTLLAANYTVNVGSANTLATVSWNYGANAVLVQNATKATISYTYYPATYSNNPIMITLLQLIPLFIALLLLVAVVALVRI